MFFLKEQKDRISLTLLINDQHDSLVFLTVGHVGLWVTFGIRTAPSAERWLVPGGVLKTSMSCWHWLKQKNTQSAGIQHCLWQRRGSNPQTACGFALSQQNQSTASRSGDSWDSADTYLPSYLCFKYFFSCTRSSRELPWGSRDTIPHDSKDLAGKSNPISQYMTSLCLCVCACVCVCVCVCSWKWKLPAQQHSTHFLFSIFFPRVLSWFQCQRK